MSTQSQFHDLVVEALNKKVTANDVKKFLAAIQTVVKKQLSKEGVAKIPKMMTLRVTRKPAREACTKVVFGKQQAVSAKPASCKLRVVALKQLREGVKL